MGLLERLTKMFPGPAVPRGTYTDWHWPEVETPSGYRRFEHTVLPELDPGEHTHYFWSHQVGFIGGEGGYLGLQTRGNRVDGSLGKMAIYSIWNAIDADGPGTQRFSGEGSGFSCRIPYYWDAGTRYRLSIAAVGNAWWEARVTEGDADASTLIGRIRVPGDWGGLGAWSVMWTEYYGGAISRCRDLPYSKVVFGTPEADGGATSPRRSENRIGTGTCHNSRVDDVDGGVRHEMGIPEA